MSRTTVRWGTILVAFAACSCVGSPVSLTAQRGSSILVPVGPYNWENAPVQLGFGRPQQPGPVNSDNAAWVDAQRGQLEFFIDDGVPAADEVFLLRATSASNANPASSIARNPIYLPGVASLSQVTALLDVPAAAPLGKHTLRYRNTQTPSVSAVIGDIWVLPSSVTLPDGTSVTGKPTPFTYLGYSVTGSIKQTVPDPQLIIPLPVPVYALEFGVKFPTSIAQIVDVYEFRTDRTTDLAWVSLTSCNPACYPLSQYKVKAVSLSEDGITSLALVFRLLGTTPVNPTAGPPAAPQVQVFRFLVRDKNGQPIEELPEGAFLSLDSSTFYIQ